MNEKKKKKTLASILKEARNSFEYEAEGLKLKVADTLIEKMEGQNMSRSELAAEVGVTPAYITKVLRGYANLSLETLAKFAFALGCRWETVMIPLEAKADLWAILEYKETEPSSNIEDDSEYSGRRMAVKLFTEETHVCASSA